MPKAEWDEVSDGVPEPWWDCDSSGYTYPLFNEDDGLIHSINRFDKTPEGETYLMFCGKEFSHHTVIETLGKEVNCLMCIAEDHDDR